MPNRAFKRDTPIIAHKCDLRDVFPCQFRERRQRKRRGSSVVGFCDAPPNPGELAELVEIIGVRQVLSVLAVITAGVWIWALV